MHKLFIGIDVQIRRPCAYAVADESGMLIESGWFPTAAEGFQCLEAELEHLLFNLSRPAVV